MRLKNARTVASEDVQHFKWANSDRQKLRNGTKTDPYIARIGSVQTYSTLVGASCALHASLWRVRKAQLVPNTEATSTLVEPV